MVYRSLVSGGSRGSIFLLSEKMTQNKKHTVKEGRNMDVKVI